MALSEYRQHKIYLAATMGYGVGSDDPEEVALYNKITEDIKGGNKNLNKGTSRTD